MNRIRIFSLASLITLMASIPAMAGTVVSSPVNGATVGSPFMLIMAADYCGSQPVTYVGFSIDDSPNTSIYAGQKMDGPVNSGGGYHVVHIKVWGNAGQVCVTDVGINVGSASGSSGGSNSFNSIVPANAVKYTNVQAYGNWEQIHDGGTVGSSSGWTGTQASPSLTGVAREFATTFNYYGGQRYSVSFDHDTTSTNFFYDTWIYIAGSTAGFANLEFDMNQTMPNGNTAVMGFQCDSWNNTWDFAWNNGSPTNFNDTWAHSSAYCNAKQWSPNTWHHVQIWYSHDSNGYVTYHAVWLDGAEEGINATVFSGFALGWGPAEVANFQIDGSSAGTTSTNVYLDQTTFYRW